ncbi:uncharacterized protein LOC129900564 [Solanum dulcamara]|uniref:uncharacterized protein LOC129900564 n=1 Tax=Solanum dulcamara TaxID=45834 RepID=UPI0024853658|nr:uncharacterized protein LOC129900564 [Solanum dulcamara]
MKTKASMMLFLFLFLFLLHLGAEPRDCCGGWASPMTRASGTQQIKTTEDYAGDPNVFDDVYRQHEDIPSPEILAPTSAADIRLRVLDGSSRSICGASMEEES